MNKVALRIQKQTNLQQPPTQTYFCWLGTENKHISLFTTGIQLKTKTLLLITDIYSAINDLMC